MEKPKITNSDQKPHIFSEEAVQGEGCFNAPAANTTAQFLRHFSLRLKGTESTREDGGTTPKGTKKSACLGKRRSRQAS
jgi:hypothetical protein